jgi:hypothetical protein
MIFLFFCLNFAVGRWSWMVSSFALFVCDEGMWMDVI